MTLSVVYKIAWVTPALIIYFSAGVLAIFISCGLPEPVTDEDADNPLHFSFV